jgi:hypothetical protein
MTPALPFGRHKDVPITDVPAAYLAWLIRTVRLSSGLRRAVAAELSRRGLDVPPPPPPPEPGRCWRCGGTDCVYRWAEDRLGRRQLRRECERCGQFRGFAAQVEPFTTEADAAASATAVLDVLMECEDLGLELRSDGAVAEFAGTDWHRAPPELRDRLRQCRRQLGRLLGDTRGVEEQGGE